MDRRYASFVCVATWLLHSKLAVPAQVHGQDLSDGETLCDVGVIACTDEGALSQMAGPAERPRDWPHGQCIDRKDRCGEWARLGHCEGFTAEYMARWCSRSCSRCSDSPRVVFEGASSYGRIYVVDEGNLRHLRFDHWAGDDQSSIHLGPFQPAIPEMSAASTEKTRPRQQTPAIRPRSTEGVPVEAGIRTVATEYVRYSAGIASLLGSRATMHKAANGGENAGPRRALVIGIGGGSYVRLLRGSFPHCAVDGVELDPIVLQVARQYFGVAESEQGSNGLLRLFIDDGANWVDRQLVKLAEALGSNDNDTVENLKYDIILVDTYSPLLPFASLDEPPPSEPPKHWTKSGDFKEPDIPPQFTTVEFFRKLVTLLAPGGAIAINVAVEDPVAEAEIVANFSWAMGRRRPPPPPRRHAVTLAERTAVAIRKLVDFEGTNGAVEGEIVSSWAQMLNGICAAAQGVAQQATPEVAKYDDRVGGAISTEWLELESALGQELSSLRLHGECAALERDGCLSLGTPVSRNTIVVGVAPARGLADPDPPYYAKLFDALHGVG